MKYDRIALALFVFIGVILPALFSFFTLNTEFLYTEDAAKYVLLGRSLAEGKGYTSIWEINPSPHRKYAPLLPVLLSPFSALSPLNVLMMKILMKSLAFLCAIIIFLYFYRRKTGLAGAILITAAYVLPADFLYYSEGPNPLHLYTLLSFLGLWSLETFIDKGSGIVRNALIASLLCALCFFAKGNGLALIMAGCAVLLLGAPLSPINRRKALIFVSITMIALLLWFGRSFLAGGRGEGGYGHSYTSELVMKNMDVPLEEVRAGAADIAGRISANAAFYGRNLAVTTNNPYLILLETYLLLCGIVLAIRKKETVPAAYWLLYSAIILLFTFRGTRMYTPIRPLSAYFVISGLSAHAEMAGTFWKRRGSPLFRALEKPLTLLLMPVLVVAIGFAGFDNAAKIKYAYSCRPQVFWDFMKACEEIKSRTDAADTFYSSIAPALFLYTGRRASYPPMTRDGDKILGRIRGDKVKYVMLQGWGNFFSDETIYPFIEANPRYFKQIYRNDTCRIYKVEGMRD
ncbi:MAG: hypothetical protein JW919_06175 [Candidatus Omnitrophica bacterium]|nr:hypothetical protein [Candidatus Omnitrophota bacterium]